MTADKTSTHLPEPPSPSTASPKPRFSSALPWLSIILSGLLVVTLPIAFFKLYSFINKFSTSNTDTQHALQNQIQKLQSSQQQMNQAISANEQQIHNLEQTHPTEAATISDMQKANYYLELAEMNAQRMHNPTAVIHFLRSADQILEKDAHLQNTRLRQAIAQDLATIEAITPIPTEDLLQKIDELRKNIAQLKQHSVSVSASSSPIASHPISSATWQDNMYDNLRQLRGLISIRHQDEAWLPPSQQYIGLIYDQISLTLEQAQLGLIEQNQPLFSAAIQGTINSLKSGFDPNHPSTHAILQTLEKLKATPVSYSMPILQSYTPFFTTVEKSNEAQIVTGKDAL